jgi:hypothetical protein
VSPLAKRIALGVVVLLLLGAAGLYWLWRQATALPEWYEANAAEMERDSGAEAPPARWVGLDERGDPIVDDAFDAIEFGPTEAPAPSPSAVPAPDLKAPPKRARRRARSHEMRGFHRAPRPKAAAGSKAVKASRAHYEDGRLEAGMVVDLSKIPKDELSEKDRALHDRAVRNFPGLTRRDVYVGIEDRPVTREGYLQLGASPQVRVGNLRYPLHKAANKLGIAEVRLRRDIDRELRRMGLVDPDAPPLAE